jgi:hypothetical protein
VVNVCIRGGLQLFKLALTYLDNFQFSVFGVSMLTFLLFNGMPSGMWYFVR